MARCISGNEILDLFEWTEHELIEAVQGGLAPFDPIYGARITREKDPCLYCDGGEIVDHSIVLEHHILSDSGGLMSAPGGLMGEYEAYTRMRRCPAVIIPAGPLKGPWLCKDKWQREELAKRLLEAKFLTAEVREYAVGHGLRALIPATKNEESSLNPRQDVCNKTMSPNQPWISGKDVMDGLGMLPVELAVACFMLDVDVTCPRRGTILNPFIQFVTAEWYRNNKDILKIYEETPDKKCHEYMQEVLEKTAKDLLPEVREEIFDFWVDGASDFLFDRCGIERIEKVYVNSGLREPFFTKNEFGQSLQTPTDTPDNPLDYGKQLVSKGYPPQERISRIKEAFPWLTTGQIGAYARGLEPGEISKAANKKWYQDNKPR